MVVNSLLRTLFGRVVNLAFLKPDFEILACFQHTSQNLVFSGFFQSERLDSDKTLSELYVHYKSLQMRGYDHAQCKEH